MQNFKENSYGTNEESEYTSIGVFKSTKSISESPLIEELFNDYKKNFQIKNLSSIANIISSLESLDPESPYLDIINGEQYLYHGNYDKSFFYLNKYLSENAEVDPYALLVIATWNETAGFYKIAFSQFTKLCEIITDEKMLAWVLFCAITNKKRCKFLNKAASYYERLICIPEGYKLLRLIRIEMTHLYILKGNFEAAMQMINEDKNVRQCIFLKRLKVYIDYIERNYDEVFKYKNEKPLDPYISYIIGRIGLDNPEYDYDIRYYFEKLIKQGENSAFVYNSYGNYYVKVNKLLEALEQYNNALTVDANFKPAMENMNLLKKSGVKENLLLQEYKALCKEVSFEPVESNPDVEDMGYLNINSLIGYTKLKKCPRSIEKMGALRLFSQLV